MKKYTLSKKEDPFKFLVWFLNTLRTQIYTTIQGSFRHAFLHQLVDLISHAFQGRVRVVSRKPADSAMIKKFGVKSKYEDPPQGSTFMTNSLLQLPKIHSLRFSWTFHRHHCFWTSENPASFHKYPSSTCFPNSITVHLKYDACDIHIYRTWVIL